MPEPQQPMQPPTQQPRQPGQSNDPQHRTSLVMPILLIALGALFLFRNWNPGFSPFHLLRTYWPLILILVGLGKIWDASRNRTGSGGQSSSGVALGSTLGVVAFVVVLVILLGHYQRSRSFASGGGDRSDDSDRSDYSSHTEQVLELQGATAVRAELKMGAGQLNVSGGSGHLLNSRFMFDRKWDSPRVDYQVVDGKGHLEISQEQGGIHFGPSDNTWDLNFNNDVPLELEVEMGAGQGNLRLRDMNVKDLRLHMGAGQVELDLTGERKSDLNVEIKGGVGQATIRLPHDVGVSAHAAGGLGTINARGMQKDGNEYHNDVYGKTEHRIRLDVEGGIGEIDLIEE
jgi:N-terminal domain of toast_rack, DUF2154/Domain of unknown function (DUF5668)